MDRIQALILEVENLPGDTIITASLMLHMLKQADERISADEINKLYEG